MARDVQRGIQIPRSSERAGREILKAFDRGFNDLPKYDGPIVRDLQIDLNEALKQFKAGETFALDAYSSFTIKSGYKPGDEDVPRNVRLIVDKNTSGRGIWGLSLSKHEAEVIVPKDQKYEIKKIEQADSPPYIRVHIQEISE